MSRTRPSLRLATADDFALYAGRPIPDWCLEWVGYAAERDGDVIALGIVCWDKFGRVWCWFNRRRKLSPFLMHRLARRTIGHLQEMGVERLHAFCDERIENSDKWLRRLGFRPGPVVPPERRPVWICDLST